MEIVHLRTPWKAGKSFSFPKSSPEVWRCWNIVLIFVSRLLRFPQPFGEEKKKFIISFSGFGEHLKLNERGWVELLKAQFSSPGNSSLLACKTWRRDSNSWLKNPTIPRSPSQVRRRGGKTLFFFTFETFFASRRNWQGWLAWQIGPNWQHLRAQAVVRLAGGGGSWLRNSKKNFLSHFSKGWDAN